MKALKVKTKIPTEHQEQVEFLAWFKLQFPHIRIFSIPNGFFSRNFGMIKKLKQEGMTAGIPDLYSPELGIFFELKRQKGGVTSLEQKDWINYLEDRCNLKVIVAKGCSDGIKQLMEHLTQSKINQTI